MVSPILTTDNNLGKAIANEADLPNLKLIADIHIKDLKIGDKPNLLVFPQSFDEYGDKIGDSNIISIVGDRIVTGNIMGFVGVNGTLLDIRSRFAAEDGEDYFLHYMLQKVFAINLFNIQHTTNQEQIFDFLLYLFPQFLKKALAQGLFKKYRRFEYNDANVKGAIDVNRHIRENIPFRGTVAYTTRSHSYDNEVTQLIRHTIEYLRTKEQGRAVLNNDSDTKTYVSQIVSATQSYNLRDRNKIINQNLRPIKHPYFSAYTDLQKICLQILRHEAIKFGREKDQVYGILFDGAWLWEEYLNTFLKGCGFHHPKNKESRGGIKMFDKPEDEDLFDRNSRRLYPDFWKDDYILDAKYKHLDKGVGREDLYQVVTYMHCMKASNGGFVYPSDIHNEQRYQLANDGGKINVIGINVKHQCDSFGDYVKKMQAEENAVINGLLSHPKFKY